MNSLSLPEKSVLNCHQMWKKWNVGVSSECALPSKGEMDIVEYNIEMNSQFGVVNIFFEQQIEAASSPGSTIQIRMQRISPRNQFLRIWRM